MNSLIIRIQKNIFFRKDLRIKKTFNLCLNFLKIGADLAIMYNLTNNTKTVENNNT